MDAIEVKGKDKRSLDMAIAELRKQMKKAGTMADYHRHTEFIGPSKKRRLKRERAKATRIQEAKRAARKRG